MTDQNDPTGNRLIDSLDGETRERLLAGVRRERMEHGARLGEVGAPLESVYFPTSAVISLIVPLSGGQSVEAATVGWEGLLGPMGIPNWESIVQLSGDMLVLSVGEYLELAVTGAFARRVAEFSSVLFSMVAQTAACNRVHPLNERAARWLLIMDDRGREGPMEITQEFLSNMLGARRPSVSVAMSTLQAAGLVRYVRGHVRVLDRERLEAAACECYQIVKALFDRLYT